MPFKIVQTIERGEALLSVVPSAWEQDGILNWPNSKKVSRIVKKGNSRPEADWTQHPCIRKRQGIRTFEDAENELRIMEENSDTDGGAIVGKIETITQQKKKTNPVGNFIDHDFNELICNQFEQPAGSVQIHSSSSRYSPPNELLTPLQSAASVDNQILESEEIHISSFLNEINDNLSSISATLNKLMEQFAYQKAFNDIMIQRINALHNDVNKNISQPIVQNIDDDITSKVLEVPICNQSEMDEVELRLAEKEEVNDLIKRMKSICGTSGTADGINSAYHLIDYFFKRDFLINVSWGGGSRTDDKKLAMKNYVNILNTFNCIVRLAAHKTVLRNAKSRSQRTDRLNRTSTKKTSPAIKKNVTPVDSLLPTSDVVISDIAMLR